MRLKGCNYVSESNSRADKKYGIRNSVSNSGNNNNASNGGVSKDVSNSGNSSASSNAAPKKASRVVVSPPGTFTLDASLLQSQTPDKSSDKQSASSKSANAEAGSSEKNKEATPIPSSLPVQTVPVSGVTPASEASDKAPSPAAGTPTPQGQPAANNATPAAGASAAGATAPIAGAVAAGATGAAAAGVAAANPATSPTTPAAATPAIQPGVTPIQPAATPAAATGVAAAVPVPQQTMPMGTSTPQAVFPQTPMAQPAQPTQPFEYGIRQPQQQLPVAIPAQPINPTQSYAAQQAYAQMSSKRGNTALIVGLILAIVAILALAGAAFFFLDPLKLFDNSIQVDSPSQNAVESAYKDSADEIKTQITEPFQYVNLDNLSDPKFSSISVGEVKYTDNNTEAHCDTSAVAKVQNDSIAAECSLTMQMDYDKEKGEWKAQSVRIGDPEAVPMGPPDMDKITEGIFTILRAYDSAAALTFSGSEVTSESALSNDGGTAKFVFTKTDEATGEPKTCSITTSIDWSKQKGWQVTVDSSEGIKEDETQNQEAPAEETPQQPQASGDGSSSSGGGSSSSGSSSSGGSSANNPKWQLVCYSGDLVQVPGVIEFDGSSILLKTNDLIKVVYNGQVFLTNYFELTGNGGWYRGEQTTVIGEISAGASSSKAQLVINVDYT